MESEALVELDETCAVAWAGIPAAKSMMMVQENNVRVFGNEFLAPVGLAVRTEKYIQKQCEMQESEDGGTVLGQYQDGLKPTVQVERSVAQSGIP